jgi:hypothetical protein
MQSKIFSLGVVALALGFLSIPASAAPVTGVGVVTGDNESSAERVAYRRCWYEHGRRHCRRTVSRYYYDDGYYGYGYGPSYYGPSFGLYFGGGGGHWRGHGNGHGHRGHR